MFGRQSEHINYLSLFNVPIIKDHPTSYHEKGNLTENNDEFDSYKANRGGEQG